MICKEDEARCNKFCPLTYPIGRDEMSYCWGSDCMAWVWLDAEQGRCGMAHHGPQTLREKKHMSWQQEQYLLDRFRRDLIKYFSKQGGLKEQADDCDCYEPQEKGKQ